MPSERVQRRIDRLLDDAESAADQHDWQRVTEYAQMVLGVDSDNSDALAFLAMLENAEVSTTPADDSTSPSTTHTIRDTVDAPASEPTSFANDRYQVSKFLGEGGKKRVYQAHDTLLDREVAFALIKTEGFDQTSKERISREAQAMGRLGVHPNIVAVLDLGEEDDGTPYMVTELMGGGDIEGVLDDAEENRLSLERTIEIGKAVCEGLEFAHARGIVHRDLKPGNVWLTEDGAAKIGDFGLAVMTDRSRLTREGMMVGTVSYMPPEQATGGEITPKADLYSLGAMLYEMVTGRPPFLGDEEIAIIGQHINTPPVAPTWHNGTCPRPLEALIMRLLSKDPSERPESAQDVFNALDAIDLTARGETVEHDQASLESLAGGVFVGRQREMDQLKAALEDVLGGRGRLVTLMGEPGIGKTRISEELATYAGLRGAQVLWGRCYETGGQPPYWPWVQAIRSYVREIDADELRRQIGSSASVVAEIVTDIKDRLPELQPPPQMDDPDSARFRLFDSIVSFLKSASQSQPLVIVLDDLHWSDRPSLTFLEFMAREIGQSRVMLICAYRDMELNRRHPLTVTLGDLARERLYERVLLRGLTEQDIARFIEIAVGFTVPSELSATIHRHTEGNPLFVTEVVRELVQSGELTEEMVSGRSTWSVRIPEGVREVIGRRLDRLSERANDVLTVAAVVGRDFTLGVLRELVEDTTEGQLLDVLDESLDAKIIEELPGAVGHYQFTHALMQETLTGEISLTRRVRLHARIAEALERLYGDEADQHAAELAHHCAEAEAVFGSEKLVRYSLIAGAAALSANAFEQAADHFERAMAGMGSTQDDPKLAEIHAGLGTAYRALRSIPEAVEHLTAAFDLAERSGDRELAGSIAATIIVGEDGCREMFPVRQRGLAMVDPDSLQAAAIHAELGRWNAVTGGQAGARASLDRALAIAEQHGDTGLLLRIHGIYLHVDRGDLKVESASQHALAAVELASKVNDPLSESSAHLVLADQHVFNGDRKSAESEMAAGFECARRAGDRERLSTITNTRAQLAAAYGEWQQSREFIETAIGFWADDPRSYLTGALTEYQVGDIDRGDTLLNDLEETRSRSASADLYNHDSATFLSECARVTGSAQLMKRAVQAADRTEASQPETSAIRHLFVLVARGWEAVESRDAAQARLLYPELGVPGILDFSWSGRLFSVTMPSLAGLLAYLAGADDVDEKFQSTIERCRSIGFRPYQAWACSDYAETFLDRDEPGDREKAIELQDEALVIAQELEMRPLTERILARREILRA